MDEGGEISSSHQIYPPEVAHAPATPPKQGQPDQNTICKNWLKNQSDEAVTEETPAKSFDYLGSTSQYYDVNRGMCNGFSMDDVETWNSISCRDLLALADATARKGSDDGGVGGGSSSSNCGSGAGEICLQLGSGLYSRSKTSETQQYGWLSLNNYLSDLNLPPQMESTSLSPRFTPVTPDQARRREQKQVVSDIVISTENSRTNVAADSEQPQLIIQQPQTDVADVSTLVEANQDFEKGLTEQTDLNETPQPKQRRRKHRPKVVKEGQPKRARKSATPTPKPDGSSTGKRKYVRRKGVEKPTDQETKKSCKRKINFDELEQVTEVVNEKTQVEIAVDKTLDGSQTPSLITPDKTELPPRRSTMDATITNRKAKCKINFLQETHSKNDSTCSTGACYEMGQVQESKRGLSTKIDGKELWDENELVCPESLEAYLARFTDYNKQGFKNSIMSATTSSCAKQNAEKAPEMPKVNGVKDDQKSCRYMQTSNKKRTKAIARVRGSDSFAGMMNSRHWQTPEGGSIYEASFRQHTFMEAHAEDFQVSMATKKQIKKSSMVSSFYNDHHCFTNHIGRHTKIRRTNMYEIEALSMRFMRLDINYQMAEENREKNALVLYQRSGSLVPYEGLFNPMKKRKPRPKVNLDDETTRVWNLLLEDINSKGIDGTDEDKAKWWEEERRVFRGRADSFIARMHLVQGDRRFSRWKGSVLDSVIGVFLTQNVSDHLSSSAFMSLASRYPLKSKNSNEPLQEDQDETIEWHEKSNQPSGDHDPMMLQDSDSYKEIEVVNSNELSKFSVDLNDNLECEVPELSERDLAIYKESVVDRIEADDIVSSQNSAEASPSSVQSSIVHATEDQKNGSKATVLGGCSSFVELLHMQGSTTVKTLPPKEHELSNAHSSGALEVEFLEPSEERKTIQKKSEGCTSEESGLSAESASRVSVHLINTTSSQEAQKICNTVHAGSQEICHCEVANVSAKTANAIESNKVMETSGETVHKVVELNSNDHGSRQIVNGVEEGSSKVKREKKGKTQIQVDWDSLRLQAEVKQERERTSDTMDSLDYEAVMNAGVGEIADAIRERGMNNRLAERIKELLDRLVRDHGSTDLEWLRDVPPDKAKEYLLSFRGLGLKSVECVRLLTLHHLAFPVDTNVGRIAVRLGWVPLQPLPESLQLHLLELYPVLESIQKYLWPRLCKLDQRTLYELHYQMITFGKVFCTKSKPNCNACPMRGECRHFASAFASARLGLPAPEESMASLTENRTGQSLIKMIDQHHPTLSPASGQLQQLAEVQNRNPVIEEPATPGPIVEIPATPGPIVEVPTTPEPIIEVPATPEPEQIHQEIDIEDFCEDTEEIPMIKLNIEEFTQNLQTYMEKHMELGDGEMSKALVALTSEAAAIPTPKLKNVSQLRTEHQVYELPDSHPLLEGLDPREPDDPCPYLLAIWTPGETADSIQPPGGQCCSQESGTLCNEETCFFCNSTREANSQTVRGTLLIPCRTAMRGSFPLNGTYFQVNEVFADHESSLNPIDVPRSWLWNLPRRTVYFGTSIPTIFKGLKTEDIQYCFWRGFVCVRGFDQKTRAPRPLMARLHFPVSKLKRSRAKTDEIRP